jgi:hypothetical protein
MRPSGTLQSPTTGSLEAMIRDSDREEALAAARRLPRNAVVEVRDIEPGTFGNGNRDATAKNATETSQPAATAVNPATTTAPAATETQAVNKTETQAVSQPIQVEELPAFVPAPKSLVSDRSAAQVAAVNPGPAGTNAVLTSIPKPIDTSLTGSRSRTAMLGLPSDQLLNVGEKRKLAVELNSAVPLGLAVLTLKFDPKVVKVSAVAAGSMFSGQKKAPSITHSIDPSGVCLISISAFNGTVPMEGAGTLLWIEIEGLAPGDASLAFNKETMHLVATDARDVVLDLKHGGLTVKQ